MPRRPWGGRAWGGLALAALAAAALAGWLWWRMLAHVGLL